MPEERGKHMELGTQGLKTMIARQGGYVVDDTASFDGSPEEWSWPLLGEVSEDDCYTMVMDDDDPDAPTFVFVNEPVLTLTRLSNDETIQLELPALIGRGTKATARVSGNRAISRGHARITHGEERYLLEDNDSSNGTFVDEVRLEPHDTVCLEDGMVFRLADEDFAFHVT